jgi:hypothetical protein
VTAPQSVFSSSFYGALTDMAHQALVTKTGMRRDKSAEVAAFGEKIGSPQLVGAVCGGSGTINASGNDYAENRQLTPALYGAVAASTLLGCDANGLMTNVFANVVGRVQPASTNPSFIGGDAWGAPATINVAYNLTPPAVVADPGPDATEEEHQEAQ